MRLLRKEKSNMKNWKTTIGGILATIGAALILLDNIYAKFAGGILSAGGVLLIGIAAKDSTVK